MNIFRSLFRGILNGLRVGRPVESEARTQEEPPVVDGFDPAPVQVSAPQKAARADRYESSFTPASSQGDSFEGAERAAPVDLWGGVKVHYTTVEESSAAAVPPQEFFAASLDDLDLSALPLPLGEGGGEGHVESPLAPAVEVIAAEVEAHVAVALPAAEVETPAAPAPAEVEATVTAPPRAEPVADSGFVASFDDLALLPAAPEVAAASSGFLASLEDLGLLDPQPDPLPEGEGTSAHDVELEALLLLPKPD